MKQEAQYNKNGNFMLEIERENTEKIESVKREANIDKIFNLESWGQLFDVKKVASYEQLKNLKKLVKKKTAILVFGMSCTGKTTAAKAIAEKIKAELICIDKVSLEVLVRTDMNIPIEMLDIQTSEIISKRLRSYGKGNRPLVIEGEFINPIARATMLKGLRICGFERVIGVSTMSISMDMHRLYSKKRVLYQIYANESSYDVKSYKDFMNKNFHNQIVPEAKANEIDYYE